MTAAMSWPSQRISNFSSHKMARHKMTRGAETMSPAPRCAVIMLLRSTSLSLLLAHRHFLVFVKRQETVLVLVGHIEPRTGFVFLFGIDRREEFLLAQLLVAVLVERRESLFRGLSLLLLRPGHQGHEHAGDHCKCQKSLHTNTPRACLGTNCGLLPS